MSHRNAGHDLTAWLDRHGYRHSHAQKQKTPHPYGMQPQAPGAVESSKSADWQDGFKFGKEAAQEELANYGRASVRVTLDQLRAFASRDFDLGQVAGYERVLEPPFATYTAAATAASARQLLKNLALLSTKARREADTALLELVTRASKGDSGALIELRPALAELSAVPKGSKVEVDTSAYRRNHGSEPKGFANWTFVIGKRDYDRSDDPAIYRPAQERGAHKGGVTGLPYSKAKEHAIAEAKRRGMLVVGVAS